MHPYDDTRHPTGKTSTTSTTSLFRRRGLRGPIALLSGLLLAGASLSLTAPAAGAADTDGPKTAAAAAAEDFQQVTLAKGEPEVGEPMSLAVLPDRSVLHTSRDGELLRCDRGSLGFLEPDELNGFLTEAGFTIEGQYGGWTRGPITGRARSIVTVAATPS